MNKKIVCYFSASGITKKVAMQISDVLSCDLFEIEPVNKYTDEDLDWTNSNSRSSIEMNDKKFRPQIKNKVINIDTYDTVILGFPIWWYTAPTIINTFIEENNLDNKNIYIFVTSGSSNVDSCLNDLKVKYPNLKFVKGKRFDLRENIDEIESFIDE